MHKGNFVKIGLLVAGLAVLGIVIYQIPAVNDRLSWRVDFALTYARSALNPVGDLPTALPQPAVAVTLHPTHTPLPNAATEASTPTPGPTATPTLTPTPIPDSISLTPPQWEKQDINNCGPASLAMYLRYYGWEEDQFPIADLLKPLREDRNVNVEELVFYARTRVGWLRSEFRVGGDIQLMKKFLAAGIPVMIEEGFSLDETYWPNDDRWAGHYLLLTAYDDAAETFTAQDSFTGPDRKVTYASMDKNWQAFNRVYILVYRPEQEETVRSILGDDWDVDINRRNALEAAKAEAEADPQDAFAWFNLGSNLVYFEEYGEAARAYDQARNIGLPHRMLRYQFGPFFAYFFSGRNEDLLALTEYALQRTPNSEEALLWRGWSLYREGQTGQAIADFNQALAENPNYQDAQYALEFIRENQ
ncbi:MAG TPA: C39 family peptidase [Anaerolineales bacterium]